MSELENRTENTDEVSSIQETDKARRKRERAEAKEKKAQEKREAKMAPGGRKKGKKKTGLIIALVLVVLLAGYMIVSSVVAGNTPMQVATITATVGTVEETLSTSGTVSSEETRTYYSPVSAPIAEMNLALGDEVTEGQLLVTFDTTDLENSAQKAQLDASVAANSYRSSQYQSDKNQSEYNEATIGLEELKTLAQQQEQYVLGLKYQLEDETQAQKEKLQDWLGKLNQELEIQNNKLAEQTDPETRERIQEIVQNLNNSIRETSNQISDLSMSEELKEKQRLIDLEQKKLDDMNEEISKREGKESSSEGGISDPYAKQQQADSAQSSQLTAQEAADKLARAQEGVTSEFSGIVTRIASSSSTSSGSGIQKGAMVSEGSELFTIESNRQVKVNVEITRYDLPKIALGQSAEVTIADQVYEGEVTKINKVASANSQGTAVVGAEIHIKNPDSSIFLGVEAKVLIHTAEAENAVTIPLEIVNADKEGDFCYVVENGTVVMRRIVSGISSDTMIEVKEGLKEGDQVVYDMTGAVTEGMTVTAMPMDGGLAVPAAGMQEGAAETEETSVQTETEETGAQAETEETGAQTNTEETGAQTNTQAADAAE